MPTTSTSTTPSLLDRVVASIAHGTTVKAWRGLAAECISEASGAELAAANAEDLEEASLAKRLRARAMKLRRIALECTERGARVEASGEVWAAGGAP